MGPKLDTKEIELLNSISKLLNQYESDYGNERILGCVVEINEDFYEWNGQEMLYRGLRMTWTKKTEGQ